MTPPDRPDQMHQNAVCCFEWRDHRVVLSGCTEAIAGELSEILALEPCPSRETDVVDITITRTNAGAEVLYDAALCRLVDRDALLIHLGTLVSSAFVRKANSPNLLHAAGYLEGEGATLISGPAYFGKSNLSFLAWSRGYRILGDDWLFYSRDTAEVYPVPKPMKPRVHPTDYPAMSALCGDHPHSYGAFRGEHRLMVGRSEGFYNDWDQPVRIERFVFLDKSPDASSRIDRVDVREALPLLLAQTLLNEATMTLQAVTFAKSLLTAGTRLYKLSIGGEAYSEAFDLMINGSEGFP
jgi:hypothetical protein